MYPNLHNKSRANLLKPNVSSIVFSLQLHNFDFFNSFQNVIVLDLSQDISSTTTSTTTTTATTESPIGVGNNVLSGKTNKQTKQAIFYSM